MGIAKGYKPLEMCCDENAELLVVSWGSPFGQARSAVERSRKKSLPVAHLQLRHLWPLPLELGDYLSRFKKVLVPELNLGQLSRLLRGEYPGVDIHELHKMRGKPFNTDEIQDEIERLLGVES
jgi:2-oxoglutarate ferredoxin oxidoreductase subunit alpha